MRITVYVKTNAMFAVTSKAVVTHATTMQLRYNLRLIELWFKSNST